MSNLTNGINENSFWDYVISWDENFNNILAAIFAKNISLITSRRERELFFAIIIHASLVGNEESNLGFYITLILVCYIFFFLCLGQGADFPENDARTEGTMKITYSIEL